MCARRVHKVTVRLANDSRPFNRSRIRPDTRDVCTASNPPPSPQTSTHLPVKLSLTASASEWTPTPPTVASITAELPALSIAPAAPAPARSTTPAAAAPADDEDGVLDFEGDDGPAKLTGDAGLDREVRGWLVEFLSTRAPPLSSHLRPTHSSPHHHRST